MINLTEGGDHRVVTRKEMAKWNLRIKRELKIGLKQLKTGVYTDADVFDNFLSWMRAQKFQEPMTDELKDSLLSPDGEWAISFRQTAKDFVFVQLATFRMKSFSELERKLLTRMGSDDGDGEEGIEGLQQQEETVETAV